MIASFIHSFAIYFPKEARQMPWELTAAAPSFVSKVVQSLGSDYIIHGPIAIHRQAEVEEQVIMKGPIVVSAHCFVGAHAYLRGGVWLGDRVRIGPGCELKSSFIFPESVLAHFNFAGDSIIGSNVNFEAGAIVANHFNERKQKNIDVIINDKRMVTGSTKFGALVGDGCRIGANAVLSPGTILEPGSVVRRLELVEQVKYID